MGLASALLRQRWAWVALTLATTVLLSACPSSGEVDGTDAPPTAVPSPTPTTIPSEPGVSDDEILFGQSAAFSGPAQELGTEMRLGIRVAFHEANRNGGVNGRQLELVSVDDAYEPEMAIANTLHLIDELEVFALIGSVGTPTSRSATPITADAGVPYIAPFTGAAFLRDPALTNVVNLRASYFQETEEMIRQLVDDLGYTRIAVLHQDDSFGQAGYLGVRLALDRRDMEPVALGVYPRNTTAVKTAVLDLKAGDPEAVILVGAYEPVANVISWALQLGMDPVFMTLSFVGSNALAEELGSDGLGVFVTQVVPSPKDNSIPIVESYTRALFDFAPAAVPSYGSLEGYLAGRLAIAGLEGCGPDVSRECFLESLRGASVIDIDGFQLRYGRGDNQGSDSVFLTVIGPDASFNPVDSLREASEEDAEMEDTGA